MPRTFRELSNDPLLPYAAQFDSNKNQEYTAYLQQYGKPETPHPWGTTALTGYLSFSNAMRLGVTCSRWSWQFLFAVMNEWSLAFIGMGRQLEVLALPGRILSVGLFVALFFIQLGLALKHAVYVTEEEKQTLDFLERIHLFFERLGLELRKRCAPRLINDGVWMIINAVTNFREVFGLSASAANTLLMGFLLFDFLFILVQWRWKEQLHREYLTTVDKSSVQAEKAEQEMIGQRATFKANALAAGLMLTGLSIAALAASVSPLLGAAGFFVMVVGTALYLSASDYGKYIQSKESSDLVTFERSMLKYSVLPMLGTLAFALLGWPGAVAFGVALFVFSQLTAVETKAQLEQQSLKSV